MKKLMLGLMMAFAVTVARAEVKTNVQIGDLIYSLDTESKTATITDYDYSTRLTMVDVAEVEYQEQKYTVTSVGDTALLNNPSLTLVCLPNATTIGMGAFNLCGSLTSVYLPNATTIEYFAFDSCGSLTSVYLPNATTIGRGAFQNCTSLTSVYLPNATTIGKDAFLECDKLETVILSFGLLANPDRESWKLRNEAKLLEPFTNDEVKNAAYKVAVFAGENLMSGENYEKGCAYYGLTPKTEPQVVKEDEIAVKKESIQAAKAETISIANNEIQLGVSVMSNSNITAEIANWGKVKFTKDTKVTLNEDGTKLIISIPVSTQQGFMILQSGEGKAVPSDAVPHSPIALPIFDPEIR